MRYSIAFVLFLLAALTGCAHISHKDPKSGLEVSYTGSARGAVDIVYATDPRAFDLASKAVDKGMPTSLARDADGNVRFNAGYSYDGYYPGGLVGGYAPANTRYIPGHGFVVDPSVSTLPPLPTSVVVTGVPQTQTSGGAIEPCPTDHAPTTTAQQAACAMDGVKSLTRNRTR